MVRVQLPLILGARSKPDPDIAVCQGSARDYAESHPTTALLAVEISDSTLIPDQQTKAALYARAGIEEYWIVNLTDQVLEVRRGRAAVERSNRGFDGLKPKRIKTKKRGSFESRFSLLFGFIEPNLQFGDLLFEPA